MRILLVTAFIPHRAIGHGAAVVSSNFVDHFASRHELWVVSFYHDPEELAAAEELKEKCAYFKAVAFPWGRLRATSCRLKALLGGNPLTVSIHSVPAMWRELKGLLEKVPFDLVQTDLPWMGQYVRLVENGNTKKILVELDVYTKPLRRSYEQETSRIKRLWRLREWKSMARYEPKVCEKFDLVYTVSEEDRELLLTMNPELNVSILRFGVDEALFKVVPKRENNRTLMFLGSFAHAPNVDAAEYFCSRIYPRIRERIPEAHLYLVGGSPPEPTRKLAELPGVTVTGWVTDVSEYLAKADVCVVPLRLGGGVKLKTLEMMAAGRPVVTTPVGCEGLAARDGQHLLVADSEEEFASRVCALLHDKAARAALGREARALIRKEHRWESNLLRIEKDYLQFVQGDRNVTALVEKAQEAAAFACDA